MDCLVLISLLFESEFECVHLLSDWIIKFIMWKKHAAYFPNSNSYRLKTIKDIKSEIYVYVASRNKGGRVTNKFACTRQFLRIIYISIICIFWFLLLSINCIYRFKFLVRKIMHSKIVSSTNFCLANVITNFSKIIAKVTCLEVSLWQKFCVHRTIESACLIL